MCISIVSHFTVTFARGTCASLSHKSSSGGGGGGGSMKELWPLEENKYIFLLNGELYDP